MTRNLSARRRNSWIKLTRGRLDSFEIASRMKAAPKWLKGYLDFCWTAKFAQPRAILELEVDGVSVSATEWRKTIAHGVSRGLASLKTTSPEGATEKSPSLPTGFLSPLRGFCRSVPITHGSRRGLFSAAPPRLVRVLIALCCFAFLSETCAAPLKTQNVFLIISDGFRWQEVFNGAEADLLTKENGGVQDTNSIRAEFWRGTPEERREVLLPFFWTGIAKHGQ